MPRVQYHSPLRLRAQTPSSDRAIARLRPTRGIPCRPLRVIWLGGNGPRASTGPRMPPPEALGGRMRGRKDSPERDFIGEIGYGPSWATTEAGIRRAALISRAGAVKACQTAYARSLPDFIGVSSSE